MAGIKDAHARNGSKRESPHWLGEAATAMRAQMSETLILAMHQARLVSAAVRCVGPSWRNTKVRRATSRIFENGGVIVFHVNTLSLFFPVNEAAMWFLFSSRIPSPHIPTEKVSVFWLLRDNSAKKVSEAFWWVSKLGKSSECGAAFRSTKTRFYLNKKHEKTCSFASK